MAHEAHPIPQPCSILYHETLAPLGPRVHGPLTPLPIFSESCPQRSPADPQPTWKCEASNRCRVLSLSTPLVALQPLNKTVSGLAGLGGLEGEGKGHVVQDLPSGFPDRACGNSEALEAEREGREEGGERGPGTQQPEAERKRMC